MQQREHHQGSERHRAREIGPSSPTFDPLTSASPSPSPALSAYSYSSTSSADDFSDQDPDLNALSLEAIEEPQYHLADPLSSPRGRQTLGIDPAYAEIDPRQSALASGAATPVASQSSASLYSMNTSHTASASPTGSCLPAFSSLYRMPSPRQASEGSSSSSHHTPIYADLASSTAQPPSPPDSEEERIDRENEPDGFDVLDVDEEDMHADGIPAARGWKLDARKADTCEFRSKVLELFTKQLRLNGWTEDTVDPSLWPLQPSQLGLKRISGAFTNAVFFASYKGSEALRTTVAAPPTVLLRVYGASSEALLSRRAELLILHTLSSLYEIGPHILGTFANGRVEEFYDCDPIQKEGMRDFGDREAYMLPDGSLVVKGREGQAHWVARRMNELHSVPLEVMRTVLEQGNLRGPSEKGFGRGIENHVMASSHRPRRTNRHRYTSGAPDKDGVNPHLYGLDSRGLIRASPAPLGTGEPSPASAEETPAGRAFAHRNSSTVSLDSLATSYNSQSSFFGDSPSLVGDASPGISTSSTSNTPNSYFPRVANGPMSPLALAPQGAASFGPKTSRGPYPGVWRRLKRWSREAAKVVELVDAFAKSESGAKAIALCFSGHPSIRQELQAGPNALSTATIGPTPGNLRNTLRAIRAIDLVSLYREVEDFKRFVRKWERREGPSRRVFAHNDAQYGNLLAIKHLNVTSSSLTAQPEQGLREAKSPSLDTPSIPAGMPRLPSHDARRDSSTSAAGAQSPVFARSKSHNRANFRKPAPLHHRIVVIDFEYASPNPRAYDIANHFQEWRADYHHPTLSWSLTHHGSYPDAQQRRKWLRAYVEQGRLLRMGGRASKGGPAALDVPGDITLPPPVTALQKAPSSTNVEGPTTAEKTSAPITPRTGAAQVAALEKSSGERNRPPLLQNSSNASTGFSLIARGSLLGSSTHEGRSQGSRSLGKKSSNESISSSSWQAPPSGPLRAIRSSAPSTPASCLGPISPSLDGSSSPQVLALASLDASIEKEIDRLEREVQLWSPATHAVWGLWGIVFAKEELETVLALAKAEAEGQAIEETVLSEVSTPALPSRACTETFDNLRYALGRIELFRQEFRQLKELGLDAI